MGKGDLAARGRTRAALSAWLVFEDEAGFTMTPPTSRTWSRRGHTPIARVRGRSRQHLSIAALTCYKPGERPRLIYRPAPARQPDGRKGFAWYHYRDLLTAAHHQLGGPIVLIWDNLNTHVCSAMKKFIAEHDWLTVYQLPAYSPDLNPTEGIWSLVRRALANIAFADLAHLEHAIRQRLRIIQHQPALIPLCQSGVSHPVSPG
nr:IS630 family transposase [Actinospica robiniae]